jgi:hypothetical protein
VRPWLRSGAYARPLNLVFKSFMRRSTRVLIILSALVLGAVAIPTVRWSWRDHRVWAFCGDLRAGMRVSELLQLEERHGIDATYLVPFSRDAFQHQLDAHELNFIGGFPGDPDFVCAVELNGSVVTVAKVVPE